MTIRWVALRAVGDGTRRSAHVDVDALRREFPSLAITTEPDAAGPRTLVVVAGAWADEAFDLWRFDRQLDELAAAGPFGLCVVAEPWRLRSIALEVLTRAQRHVARRNAASSTAVFDRVLELHAELHDVRKPLVRADYDHALDVWQWMLRLDPMATVGAQIAALFHDVERLVSEATARVEHRAIDYQAFKDAHAARGASMIRGVLADSGLSASDVDVAAELVGAHERRDAGSPDASLLADADALSFFSMNSGGYLDYFGPEQTRKKIRYTLRRLSEQRIPNIGAARLRADVRALVDDELSSASAPISATGGAR